MQPQIRNPTKVSERCGPKPARLKTLIIQIEI